MDSKDFRNSLARRSEIRREIKEDKRIAIEIFPKAIRFVLKRIESYAEHLEAEMPVSQEETYITVSDLKDALEIKSTIANQIYQMLKNNEIIDSDGDIVITKRETEEYEI